MKKILHKLFDPIKSLIEHYRLKKRLKEIRKRDPFIYK